MGYSVYFEHRATVLTWWRPGTVCVCPVTALKLLALEDLTPLYINKAQALV